MSLANVYVICCQFVTRHTITSSPIGGTVPRRAAAVPAGELAVKLDGCTRMDDRG